MQLFRGPLCLKLCRLEAAATAICCREVGLLKRSPHDLRRRLRYSAREQSGNTASALLHLTHYPVLELLGTALRTATQQRSDDKAPYVHV